MSTNTPSTTAVIGTRMWKPPARRRGTSSDEHLLRAVCRRGDAIARQHAEGGFLGQFLFVQSGRHEWLAEQCPLDPVTQPFRNVTEAESTFSRSCATSTWDGPESSLQPRPKRPHRRRTSSPDAADCSRAISETLAREQPRPNTYRAHRRTTAGDRRLGLRSSRTSPLDPQPTKPSDHRAFRRPGRAVVDLDRHRAGARQRRGEYSLGAILREQSRHPGHQSAGRPIRPADQLGMRAHRVGDVSRSGRIRPQRAGRTHERGRAA